VEADCGGKARGAVGTEEEVCECVGRLGRIAE
jgi:hypothetical protein